MNDVKELFAQQIAGGATDNWFYGTEIDGTVRIERHRGAIDSLRLTALKKESKENSTNRE